ncbi:N-acetylmuramoyl-L-alanine amidase family protein [Clostridium saccharobutylicum]|uniref:Autolysin n=1 Tax=Clostridium saccharobutylicum TaxID=169679 RepID=A0A1S8NJG9_CLOSA|nr:cadherin-like beta sandwich domain-containing protein [Clostridium saccharobutylicum]OOM16523.1 autolysin [Clostridium saccharobutylicum]
MNKNVIKVVALALALSGAVTLAPKELNLGVKTVYAATNSSDISALKVETNGGSNIKLYTDNDYDSDNKVDSGDVSPKETYYAKTSSKRIKLNIDGVDKQYVRVFTSDSSSSKGQKANKAITLDSGTNKVIVRVYAEDPDDNPKYKDDDNKLNDYTIKIKYTGSNDSDDSDDSNDSNDDIYLEDLTLTHSDEDVDFDFDKEKSSYNIKVKEDVSYVKVMAEPEDADYKVKVNDSRVKEDDDYEKKVTLNEGENKIVIKVTDDDDDERDYTLNITRGSSSSTNTSTDTSSDGTTNDNTNTSNSNGWSIQNGRVYYLDNSGNKQTGWLQSGDDWYYLGSDGARQTGWQNVNGNWYHMDQDGKMQTGWFKDWNGTWYYLNPYSNGTKGAMLHDTYVAGYRLGSDGAWVR